MMTALSTWFYHNTIKLYTGVFGSVFSDIKISRSNDKFVLVPIAYSVKQKYDARNRENPDPNELRKKTILPRMGFRLVSMRRDTTRITSKHHRVIENVNRDGASQVKTQYNRVPYLFSYELSIKTKSIDDMHQIMEQILPYFNPSLNLIVEDNKDLDLNTSINIKLVDSGLEDMFEGSFEDEQSIETVMQFDLEGYLYMPTQSNKIINVININYRLLGLDPDTIIDSDRIE